MATRQAPQHSISIELAQAPETTKEPQTLKPQPLILNPKPYSSASSSQKVWDAHTAQLVSEPTSGEYLLSKQTWVLGFGFIWGLQGKARGYIGIMEEKMEITILSLGIRASKP